MKKIISAILSISMVMSLAVPMTSVYAQNGAEDAVAIGKKTIPLQLYYDEEAPYGNEDLEVSKGSGPQFIESEKEDGWERWSIPLGNGYFGANVFGRTDSERIQITDKTLFNPYKVNNQYLGGLNNFSETYIDFGHAFSDVTDYSRTLSVNNAVSYVDYTYNGVNYSREYFTSYPDNAMVIKLSADTAGALNFTLRPTIPYEQDYAKVEGDGASKHGNVIASAEGNVGKIELTGKMGYYDIDFMGIYKVVTDGTGTLTYNNSTSADGVDNGTVTVSGGTSAYIIITLGTDYELCEGNIVNNLGSKPIEKTDLDDTRVKVEGYMQAIDNKLSGMAYQESYNKLLNDHIDDYAGMFGRVSLDLGIDEADLEKTTDTLLAEYQAGNTSRYLETLYFQYGRYLLIASSRPGTLPANLQGTWNRYNESPWSAGYWHNINVQMNYWPAFNTNLAETFSAYNDYNDAYMKKAQEFATSNTQTNNSALLGQDGGNGWTLGVSGWLYSMQNDASGRAPGNLGFLTEIYWDWYEFTQDKELLRDVIYPKLADAARFITKCVIEEDGKYLVKYSDSPEQYNNGEWFYTKGTTYAQSFAYLNNYHTLLAAKELGIDLEDESLLSQTDYKILKTVMAQLDKYDPIIVGLSGQVKEFRQEEYYGEIGEKNHRHISNLVGLYPGSLINETTPAWLDAAKVTLTERGDEATGWGVAHRLNLWARTKDGNRTYKLVEQLLKKNTATNLWDLHPPFQIDGNLGGTAGIAEMLLQSHEGYIAPLPAMPDKWATGQYTGLVARGNFEVSAKWDEGVLKTLNVKSLSGGEAKISYSGIDNATVKKSDGSNVNYTVIDDDLISFKTEVGETYFIGGFTKAEKPHDVTKLSADNAFLGDSKLSWTASEDAVSYNVYYAKDSDKDYTLAGNVTDTSYTFTPEAGEENARYTFKVKAVNSNGTESSGVLCYRNPEDVSATVNAVVGSVLDNGTLQVTVNATEFADGYKLYKRATTDSSWTYVTSSDIPVIIMTDYDSDLRYGVSVVSRYYDVESEVIEIKDFGAGAGKLSYDASNILAGIEIVKESNSTYDEIINLPATFNLGELKIYDYQGTSASARYAGETLKIEAGYNGNWRTVYNLTSNADILSKRVSSYLSFDMDGIKAQQLRITITPVSGYPVKINDISLSGVFSPTELMYKDNIFSGRVFEATDATAEAQVLNGASGYNNLTDGTYKGSENPARFTTKTTANAILDGTMDFGGSAILGELRLYDYDTWDNWANYAGQSIKVQVYNNGTWTTAKDITLVGGAGNNINTVYRRVLHQKDPIKDKWLSIDMGNVSAEKVRIICDTPFSASNIISFWEFECSGYISDANKVERSNNLFEGRTFVLTPEAEGYVHSSAYGVENLTDGTYRYSDGAARYSSTTKTDAVLDATLDFGAKATVDKLLVYDYDAWDSYANHAGTKVEVHGLCEDGWKELFSETLESKSDTADGNIRGYRGMLNATDPLKDRWLVFDLGGQEVTKLRVVFANPVEGRSVSLWEIECTGSIEIVEESPEIAESNALENITPVTTDNTVTYDLGRNVSLYTMDIEMGETAATADVELLVDGAWVKVANDVTLTSKGNTKVDLYGTSATKVRITFSDAKDLKDISCTTGKKPVDRTELINAFNTIPAVDTILPNLQDEYETQVGIFKEYLADTTADQDTIDGYAEEIAGFDWDSLVDILPTPEPTPTPVPTEPPVDYIINYEFTKAQDASDLGGGTQVDGIGGKTDKVMKVTSATSARNSGRYFTSETGYMTYETEIYMTNLATDWFILQVFNQGNTNGVRSAFELKNGAINLYAYESSQGSFWSSYTTSDKTLKDGWNKIAITWDMNNKKMLFYLNDVNIFERTVNSMNGIFGGDIAFSNATPNNIYIDNFRVYAEEYYITPEEPEEFSLEIISTDVDENNNIKVKLNVSNIVTVGAFNAFFTEKTDQGVLVNISRTTIEKDGDNYVSLDKYNSDSNYVLYLWQDNMSPILPQQEIK